MLNFAAPLDGIAILDSVEQTELIARLIHTEWEHDNPGETMAMCRADLIADLSPNVEIPKAFVHRQSEGALCVFGLGGGRYT